MCGASGKLSQSLLDVTENLAWRGSLPHIKARPTEAPAAYPGEANTPRVGRQVTRSGPSTAGSANEVEFPRYRPTSTEPNPRPGEADRRHGEQPRDPEVPSRSNPKDEEREPEEGRADHGGTDNEVAERIEGERSSKRYVVHDVVYSDP